MALFIQHTPASAMSVNRQGGCCMARAIAIATGRDQDTVWHDLATCNARTKAYQVVGLHSSVMAQVGKRNLEGGTIVGPPFMRYMRGLGFQHTSLLDYPKLVYADHPAFQCGRLVLTIRDHAFAMIGGVIHDAFDPQALKSYQQCGIYHYWYWKP
jgi:hypothetical protein